MSGILVLGYTLGTTHAPLAWIGWGMTGSRPLALLLLVFLALCGCQSSEPSEQSEDGSVLPDQEIDGFSLTQTREGQRVWVLKAEQALVFEDAGRVEMTSFRVDFFQESGDVRSTLTARNGLLMRRTNDMEAFGNVLLFAKDGTRLTTERLTWNERTGKIESDRFVRVVQGKDEFTGVGITADPDLKNIRVLSEFKAYVRAEDGELVEED
jgi:LPS export ABC transporter protein LptC